MSGGPEDKDALLREAVAADQWLVTHDGLIALSGALNGEDGIVAIAGTGSFIFARRADRTMRVGGWGYLYGDEGSAFWVAKQALRAALRHEEGWGPPTALSAMLRQATGAATANEVLHLFYTQEWPRSRVARLAAEVDQAATSGDEVAAVILGWAGHNLASSAGAAREPLWGPGEKEEVMASYIGGVFRSAAVMERFRSALRTGWNIVVRPPVWGAEVGALIEAYRLAGIRPDLKAGGAGLNTL
jgi:N-acetylglucosamine kinase-like BadF-type ATPase